MIGQQGIPARHGGVERAVEEVGARLAERGHEVVAFNTVRSGPRQTEWHRGIQLRAVRGTQGKFTGNLTASLHSTLITLSEQFDIVHFHAMGPSIFSPLPRLRPGTKVVVTIHGRDDLRAKWGRAARLVLSLSAHIAVTAPHALLAVSEALVGEITDDFGRTPIYVRNGVNEPAPASAESTPRPTLDGRPYILSVGRLVPEKAVDQLIAAFARIDADMQLVVVGGASGASGFEQSVNDGAAADPRVALLGPVYGEELDALYRGASLFAMPSMLEGLPLSVLEASSFGLPIICSDIPPHLEIVDADGPGHRVHRTGDVASLSEAISRALVDPDCENAGARVLQASVLDRYSWETAASELESVYRGLIES